MITTVIAYFLILLIVPITGAVATYAIFPIVFLLRTISVPSFISMLLVGIANGFVSIWLGIKILNLFNKEAGILMILIMISVYIYHYIKGSTPHFETDNDYLKDVIKKDARDNISILSGEIIGMIISWNLFIN